jgi:ankyrin repeat protein
VERKRMIRERKKGKKRNEKGHRREERKKRKRKRKEKKKKLHNINSFLYSFLMTLNALHEATKEGDIAIVKEIVEEGRENIDQIDGEGETALSLAATNGNLEIVRFLLEKGANMRLVEGMSSPPLFNACRYCL